MITPETLAVLFSFLWNLIVISSVITISVKIALRVLRSLNARIRYVVCVAGFILSLFLAVFSTFFWTRELPPSAALPIERSLHTAQSSGINKMAAPVTFVWIFISILFGGRELVSHLHLRKIRRRMESATPLLCEQLLWPQNVPLFLSQDVGPSTIGFLRPYVLLPRSILQQMPAASIAPILRHELNHVRWRDPLVHGIVRLILVLCWPAAPLWLLNKMIIAEREAAADTAAISTLNRDAKVHYAESVVKIARLLLHQTQSYYTNRLEISFNNGNQLEARILRVLSTDRAPGRVRLTCGSCLLASGILLIPWLPVVTHTVIPVTQLSSAASADMEPNKWQYLGNGYWKDPLGNRKPPHVMAPWKNLGNGKWIDGKGNVVLASELPSWIYLGEGKWYTPRIGDWMKNIQKSELNKNLIDHPSE